MSLYWQILMALITYELIKYIVYGLPFILAS
jgi:hypothetical protein